MANTTNFNWETPDDTDLVKDGAAAIRTLGSAIDTSLVDLKGGTTGQVLSKATNTDMDFTWVTSDDANAIQNAIVDAKGDLIAASAADTPARLAVGTNGHVLIADSAQTTGLKWGVDPTTDIITTAGDLIYGTAADTVARLGIGTAGQVLQVNSGATAPEWATPAGGGGMTLIQETVASSSTGISFTGISGSYKQLLLVFNGLYHSIAGSQWSVRFNASSASEYICLGIKNGGTLQTDTTNVRPPEPFLGEGATSTTNQNTINGYLLIDNYASSTKFKGFNGVSAYLGTSFFYNEVVGFWENTNAITSVDITRLNGSATLNNITNSTIRLYGIS